MTGVGHGKLVLVGEYAVLDGAPAIVAAVDHGVECTYSPTGDAIVTPGDDRFARAALGSLAIPAGTWTFRDQRPPPATGKAGFGGSAAAVVAALRCAHAVLGNAPEDAALFADALAVHRGVQGSGSGVDVAASVYGGILRFEAGSVARVAARPRLVVVWSGRSAATGPRVERYLAWRDRDAFVRESTAIVEAFPLAPIEAAEAAFQVLRAMSARAGVDWETPEITVLRQLARDRGGAAKPSGAGGGDAVVAFFPDAATEADFRDAASRAGFPPIAAVVAGPFVPA